MRVLYLGKRSLAIKVDDDDYLELVAHKWYLHPKGYASAWIDGGMVMMHRFIMKPPQHLHIDHIDHDKTNNQRSNLRIVTKGANAQNVPPKTNNTSGYVGVARNGIYWQSSIYKDKKRQFIGNFKDPISAALAYNKRAKELYGKNAYQNPIST